MYKITLWHVRVTIAAVETEQCLLFVLLSYMSLSAVWKYCVLHNNACMVNLC
jgi:hypothetical protein